MASFDGSNHSLDMNSTYPDDTTDPESYSQAHRAARITATDNAPSSPSPPEDFDLEPSLSQDEEDDTSIDNADEGIEEDSNKSIEEDDDSDWIEEIQSVSDVVFEEDSTAENEVDHASTEETRDDMSNKSDNVHGWHDQLTNNETASLTDDSYNHNSLHSQDTLQSQESLKSQESFNFQSTPLDEIDLSLNTEDMDLSQEMKELFQKSQFVPTSTYGQCSRPHKNDRPDVTMTSDTSDLDKLEKGGRKKKGKGNDSDTSSESDASLGVNHDDSDSSSSSSEGTQIWVPVKRSESFRKTLDTQSTGHRTPQRSNTMQSVRSASSNPLPGTTADKNNTGQKLQGKRLVAKHNQVTGRVDTYINQINGDSGINSQSTNIPLLGCGSRPSSLSLENAGRQTTPPTSSILKNAKEKSPRGASFSDCLFNALSSVYCILVIVLGTVLPVSQIFSQPIPQNLFEVFYVYVYGLSIVFLGYVYVYLLQNKTARSYRKHRHKDTDMRNGYSDRIYRQERSRRRSYERNPCNKVGIVTGSCHTGSFYLRLGAVVFGTGSMIHDGLKFSEMFDMERMLHCGMILTAVRPLLHLAFTFIQLYFIFLNSKMCIHKYKVLARFGLMHMLATNVCVWISVTVSEILRELISNEDRHNMDISNLTSYYYTTNSLNSSQGVNCSVKEDLMGRTVELSSPYLYPLTVQYSIICTGILFVMWQNIGNPLTKDSPYTEPEKKKTQWVVDCQGSNKGLFLGILILVGAIVSMIVFYVLIQKQQYTQMALILIYSSDIAVYCGAFLVTVLAFITMRHMHFHGNLDLSLDQALQLLGTGAVFFYSIFTLLAAIYHREVSATMMIVCACAVLVQVNLQTVFICTGLRRFCNKSSGQQVCKPGREFVAFLLICNIALWATATFERLRLDTNPIQYDFYGYLTWTLIGHICIPLIILYRFHSTVCLANIWKSAYKIKLQ